MSWFFMFNWADWLIISLIGFSIIVSVVRGFVKEALSLSAWILAFWASVVFYGHVSMYLAPHVELESLRTSISFVLIFVSVLLGCSVINYMILQFTSDSGLKPADRFLGVFFGAGRGVMLCSLLLLVGAIFTLTSELWWQSSVLIPKMAPFVAWLQGYLPDTMQATLSTQA